jgi:predicted transposase YdaD
MRETDLYEAKMEGFTEGEVKGSNLTLSIMKELKDPSNSIESISEKYGVSVEFVREIQSVVD